MNYASHWKYGYVKKSDLPVWVYMSDNRQLVFFYNINPSFKCQWTPAFIPYAPVSRVTGSKKNRLSSSRPRDSRGRFCKIYTPEQLLLEKNRVNSRI